MNKLNKKILLGIIALIGNLGASLNAEDKVNLTDWYPVTVENRPFVRWWWL